VLTDRIPQSRLGAWFVISIPCDCCILALAIDSCSQLALADDAGNARATRCRENSLAIYLPRRSAGACGRMVLFGVRSARR
jgi:hypothetical protein